MFDIPSRLPHIIPAGDVGTGSYAGISLGRASPIHDVKPPGTSLSTHLWGSAI